MDLPNNADIVLSPAHNLQVGLITFHNYLCLWESRARGWNFNRFADFGLWIAQKCVWRPGSARTRWGDPLAVIMGREGKWRKWLEIVERGGRGGKERTWSGREGRKGKGRMEMGQKCKGREGRKRKGRTWLEFCPGAPELVTPLTQLIKLQWFNQH